MNFFNKTHKANATIDSSGDGCIYADGRPLTEMDFTNPYFSYEFYNFMTSWRQYADKVIKWETIDSGYYRLETNINYILFYDSHENSCRVLTAEEAEFKTKEEWFRELSHRIIRRMNLMGINQYELAERIGSSQSSVSCYISGKKCPSAYTLRLLADALNCSLDYLIGF